ncbi:HTH-type transcriptional regulator IlvY [Pseudoalteromonas luteoviolacea B = ATCC 29581]|nr:HTH-type transcriptional regulator IlvY [Pseudoalteromonas luteoviolacea B = ATCC 29581]
MVMEHKLLQHFLVLSETLHFGRASERCFISPPTLSRQIKQLEEEVGSELFYRDNRRVKLTATGQAFVSYAKSTLASWQQFKVESLQENRPLTGTLHLFCSVTATYSFVYDLFLAFRQRFPMVELHLTTGDPAQSISQVNDEKADIAVAVKPSPLADNLCFQHLGSSPLLLIAPNTPCPLKERLDAGIEVEQLEFIVPEQGVLKTKLASWSERRGFKPTVYTHVAGHEALVSMVSLGFGLAIVPRIVLEQSPLQNRVDIMEVDDLDAIDIGLVVQKRRRQETIVQAFWSCADAVFSEPS